MFKVRTGCFFTKRDFFTRRYIYKSTVFKINVCLRVGGGGGWMQAHNDQRDI